jgi:hypothetical protein
MSAKDTIGAIPYLLIPATMGKTTSTPLREPIVWFTPEELNAEIRGIVATSAGRRYLQLTPRQAADWEFLMDQVACEDALADIAGGRGR